MRMGRAPSAFVTSLYIPPLSRTSPMVRFGKPSGRKMGEKNVTVRILFLVSFVGS